MCCDSESTLGTKKLGPQGDTAPVTLLSHCGRAETPLQVKTHVLREGALLNQFENSLIILIVLHRGTRLQVGYTLDSPSNCKLGIPVQNLSSIQMCALSAQIRVG